MNVNLPNSQRVGSWLRQAAAVAGLVVSLGNQMSLPNSVRSVVAVVSGLLLVVEHYLGDPSTGNPPPPPPPGA